MITLCARVSIHIIGYMNINVEERETWIKRMRNYRSLRETLQAAELDGLTT